MSVRAGRVVVAALVVACASFAMGARADDVEACAEKAEKAQLLRKEGALREAKKNLEACAKPSCPALVRADCLRWSADVERSLASVVFAIMDADGAPVKHARVELDGRDLGADFEGAVELDPGKHHARVVDARMGDADVDFSVARGEKEHVVELRLPRALPSPSRAPARPLESAPPPHPPARDAQSTTSIPAIAWVLGAASLAGFATAAGFWIVGTKEHGDLAASCAPAHRCTTAQVDAARSKLVAGDVLAGVSVAFAAGAVLVAVTSSGDAKGAKASVNGASFALRGAF